ncbi:hypothetical protein EVAR_90688_1 [Eumeta japonica]|uniref:Uncharacterized protein n=1 Tax=Eumeta variegata TaxID=151549 RepID=A0A4C1Z080_EUMVA|nr:hypothetical protein EVAR_90688_1 [Eumeta japonica]
MLSKKSPPAREGRVAPSARVVSTTLSYARAEARPRSVLPAAKQNQTSTADDLKQLQAASHEDAVLMLEVTISSSSLPSLDFSSRKNFAPPQTRRKN